MPSEAELAIAAQHAWVRRRSRLVRLAKIVLPLAALAMLALIFVVRPGGRSDRTLFTEAELATLGAGLKLDNPRFAGVTEGGEPFVVTADWALPDGAMPTVVDLERPRGEVNLADGRAVTAEARTGRLRRDEETLALEGAVLVRTSDGYRAETERLVLDLAAKSAESLGAVSAEGPRGTLEAGRFRMASAGAGASAATIWFEGGVRVVFFPADGD